MISGKNLVSIMLEVAGYQILIWGVDVSTDLLWKNIGRKTGNCCGGSLCFADHHHDEYEGVVKLSMNRRV
jgi:methanogenic corrinoid protein MtbC1